MESAQRSVLQAVTSAYKTVSTRALQVLAGTPPINLHIEYAIRIFNGITKSDSEAILIEQWQLLWDRSDKGRWTYEFFPNIHNRLQTLISFDHYTAQLVTGHGGFNGNLHYFNLSDNPHCSCGHTDEKLSTF
ncbi:Reverse transcriptase domain-containing protein [Aphis craccivora]|uniref:Reverse transcriptase domain-containing protein n=1 Tax=Aphis craccivora TaxID=307492 RepID=A0A6G0X6S4_APHCR|nr:Reverse transcriptase domain-containing protein [Aphis craccivora]